MSKSIRVYGEPIICANCHNKVTELATIEPEYLCVDCQNKRQEGDAVVERRSKYNAKPVEFNGIRFDSTAEYNRYRELLLLEKSGAIWGLAVHPRFELRPAATYNGVRWRAVTYVGDFEYYEDNGAKPPVHVVEDTKGVETAVFRLKRRLFAEVYPDIKFVVVKA